MTPAGTVWLDLFGSEGVGAAGTAELFDEVWSVDNNEKRHARNPFGWFLGDWREGLERAAPLRIEPLSHRPLVS